MHHWISIHFRFVLNVTWESFPRWCTCFKVDLVGFSVTTFIPTIFGHDRSVALPRPLLDESINMSTERDNCNSDNLERGTDIEDRHSFFLNNTTVLLDKNSKKEKCDRL